MYLGVDLATMMARAKLFLYGGSQAVCLPKEFQLPGSEAVISRTRNGGVLVEPLSADFECRRRRFIALAGSCPDLEDVPRHAAPDISREP